MSKSYGNFVALTDAPNDMYGKLMSIADEQIIEYFTLLTDVPESEVSEMQQAIESGENPMNFKKKLAFTITEMYHNTRAAQTAQEQFEQTVQGNQLPSDIPEVVVQTNMLSALDLLVLCAPEQSKTELRRLIDQRAVTLLPMDVKVTDPQEEVAIADGLIVKLGKRRYFAIRSSLA